MPTKSIGSALTLDQNYSAHAYFYDHQREMNQLIEQRLKREELLLSPLDDPCLRVKFPPRYFPDPSTAE